LSASIFAPLKNASLMWLPYCRHTEKINAVGVDPHYHCGNKNRFTGHSPPVTLVLKKNIHSKNSVANNIFFLSRMGVGYPFKKLRGQFLFFLLLNKWKSPLLPSLRNFMGKGSNVTIFFKGNKYESTVSQ